MVADSDGAFPLMYVESIPIDGRLAINAAGQVAFEIIYSEASGPATWDGIFVDGHLALRRSRDAEGSPFTLTDDGPVVPGLQKTALPPAPQASTTPQGKPSMLDQLHMKQPKLPFGITIGPKTPTDNEPRPVPEQLAARSPLAGITSPLAQMITNRRGQVLIPINLGTGGFMLVLGTPIAHVSQMR